MKSRHHVIQSAHITIKFSTIQLHGMFESPLLCRLPFQEALCVTRSPVFYHATQADKEAIDCPHIESSLLLHHFKNY